MLYINLSFDYQLFFGANFGSDEDILFEPTRKIADILLREGIPATFFADVCSVIQHSKYGLWDYCSSFQQQLVDLINDGNDVQLHIHPHWLRSTYDGNNWRFANDYFDLPAFTDGTSDICISGIIEESVNYLNNLIAKSNTPYDCIAYRAGGYCLNPYKQLLPILKSNGIIIDSSVAMFQYSKPGSAQQYNYMQLPQELNYYLSPDVPVDQATNKASSGIILQVPIGYYKKSFFTRIKLGKKGLSFDRGVSRGTGVQPLYKKEDKASLFKKILLYQNEYQKLSLDFTNAKLMCHSLDQMYQRYHCKAEDAFVSVIGHPKSFGGQAFDNLIQFIKMIKNEPQKYLFIRMNDIPNLLIEVK